MTYYNFVKETCTGTGAEITLLGAEVGFLSFGDASFEGDKFAYVIVDADGLKKVTGVASDFFYPDTMFRADTWAFDGTGVVADPSVNITLSGGTHTIYCAESAEQLEEILSSIGLVDSYTKKQNRNYIINGNFDVWQRGVSQTVNGYGSTDRWQYLHGGTGVSKTVTRQFFNVGDTGARREATTYSRSVVAGGSAANGFCIMRQRIEGVHSLAGRQATLSFWGRADATRDIAIELTQHFGTGGSPSTTVFLTPQKVTLNSVGFFKHELTFTVPSIFGKTLGTDGNDSLELAFWFSGGSDFNARTDSLGNQSGTFEIAQVQLEEGDRATDFELLHLSDIWVQCLRYFFRISQSNNSLGTAGQLYGTVGGTALVASSIYPVIMRGIPTFNVTTPPTYENCSDLTVVGDRVGFLARVVVASTARYRAHSWAVDIDAEL